MIQRYSRWGEGMVKTPIGLWVKWEDVESDIEVLLGYAMAEYWKHDVKDTDILDDIQRKYGVQ